ncbi:MAG: 1-deoxy-D-xylulose-5-phosphate reductoisomerase [Tissierellales bacterium]|nr:1-deoxy-D-xylulose-5-phosphate reductoisomerase [Tissierellales bacterium]MBN2826992.1 1-deoxy-D-xylulose-5-phosphate reductoisomerase [Tissierellales bacterium]
MKRGNILKNISILGSTGSIGTQTLEIARAFPDKIHVSAISGNHNIDLLEKQIDEFKPELCAVMDKSSAERLRKRISGPTKIVSGMQGLEEAATINGVEIVVTAVSGMIGLIPTLEAIKSKKTIALANKETLVAGGNLVMSLARKYNVDILPVDSEHGAIFQCLLGNKRQELSKIILTASGGPFFAKTREELLAITPEMALKHPNWEMGKKISIDSATLMNKGLEVIEAKWLFNLEAENIEVVIHPQSIIHSAVEFIDHSIIAQLSCPDMKLPIQYALFYPERMPGTTQKLDLFKVHSLTFEKPDTQTFRCLKLAFDAMIVGGSMPVVLNKANEMAVDMFLNKEISFLAIPKMIENTMLRHQASPINSVADILEAAAWTEREIKRA